MGKEKKVLFVCDKNERTSFGRLTVNLLTAVRDQFDAHVLWLKTPKFFQDDVAASGAASAPDDRGFTAHEIWAKSLYTGFFSFRGPLKKAVRDIAPDFIFFIRPELGFLVPVARSACPSARTVMFVHDTFAETLYPHSIKFKLLNMFFVRGTLCADSYVYNSNWTRLEAAKFFGKKMADAPGKVIGCPIDSAMFNAPEIPVTKEERAAFRRKHGIRNFQGMCLNVSLDEPRKNIDTYFEMAHLRPDVAFVRVGKLSERLRNIVNEKKLYNVFHFNEFSALDLREFYRNADLIVYPSFLEGFGLPPIEAIACGTPAVCARASAVEENLDGVCPLITPADDAEAYARVLDRVLAGESVVDAAAARKLLDYCSMNGFSERVLGFLEAQG
jgi:glycosyltransferase involved in cell wall biosynthesis